MLKLLGVRSLGGRDTAAVLRVLARDPVATCMVTGRVEEYGIAGRSVGGEMWSRGGAETSLCFSGANLIPLLGSPDDLQAFAERAARGQRLCSSVVGRAELADLPEAHRRDRGDGLVQRVEQREPEQPVAGGADHEHGPDDPDGQAESSGCPRHAARHY